MATGQRGVLRWKEWSPLVTQQQRLRNVIQIIAYNIQVDCELREKNSKFLFYYTLHLSPMSPPLYSSEKLESENPKWSEIEIDPAKGSASGVVIRLWAEGDDGEASVLSIWGIHFSGLIHIGPRLLSTDPTQLGPNSFVFHMPGGYFTSSHCFLNPDPVTPRTLAVQMNASSVKNSYSVHLLLRLQALQQTIKKQTIAAAALRDKISSGVFHSEDAADRATRTSATLRKLMSRPSPPRPSPESLCLAKSSIESLRFRIQLLTEEKEREEAAVKKLNALKKNLQEQNLEKEIELTNNHHALQKDLEKTRDLKKQLIEVKTQLSHTVALLDYRRKELMSELSFIYPIKLSDGKYTIQNVHLPNSENFDGKDELMISVALGFVAHLVQMMAIFLDVPTRYPIYHFGSRSRIIDHIIDSIPDKDREFPLHSRSKERLPFDYGVYLLNKNIAQLRWCCGLTTTDLRPTLSNLSGLMCLNRNHDRFPKKQTALSCSLDYGLDVFAGPSSAVDHGSDPQDYTKSPPSSSIPLATSSRSRCKTEPVSDLASLMSLDISCKSYDTVPSQEGHGPMSSPNHLYH